MTEAEEAIEFLKGKYPLGLCDEDEYKNAQTAIKALEKQIAKKPVDTEEFTEGGWIGKCPHCGSDCNDVMNYCDKCGQKLDWGEV